MEWVTTGFGVDLRGPGAGNLTSPLCAPVPANRSVRPSNWVCARAAMPWRSGRTWCPRAGSSAAIRPSNASFASSAETRTPQPRAVILTAPGEEAQVDYGTGPDGPRSADGQISTHPIVRDDAGIQPQGGTLSDLPLQLSDLGRAARESLPSTRWQYPHRGAR